jgi:hypothetical protein
MLYYISIISFNQNQLPTSTPKSSKCKKIAKTSKPDGKKAMKNPCIACKVEAHFSTCVYARKPQND